MKTGNVYNRRAARKPEWRYGLVLLASFIAALPLTLSQPLSSSEWYIIDLFARMHHKSSPPESRVATVLIDDGVVNRPRGWPIAKSTYEELSLYLLEMGASTVAFDVLFTDDLSGPQTSDTGFLRTVSINGNIVFSWLASTNDTGTCPQGTERALSPYAVGASCDHGLTAITGAQLPYERLLHNIRAAGFFNRGRAYADNVERTMPLIAAVNDSALMPSLALMSVMKAKNIRSIQWNRGSRKLSLGNGLISCTAKGEMLLDFSTEIPSYSLSDVRRSMDAWLRGEKPALDSSAFAGRLVFIGNGSVSLQDFGVTPLSRTLKPCFAPNVLLHARSAATLLSGKPPRCIPLSEQFLIAVGGILILSFIRFAFPLYHLFLSAALPFVMAPFFISFSLYGAGYVLFPLCISLSAGLFLACDFVGAHRFNLHPADAPKAYDGDKPFLFISYKREELRQASRIMFRLQAMGCRIWYDREINPGEKWQRAIMEKIRRSKCVFFMASSKAVSSKVIQRELRYALAVKKQVIPVDLDGIRSKLPASGKSFDINPTVLNYCKNTQMIDLFDRKFKRVLEGRLKDLGAKT